MASALPAKSTCTEWSTTRSTGTSGSMILGFLPSRATAERMAARSTSSGTPVKSCKHDAGDDERDFLRCAVRWAAIGPVPGRWLR